MVESANADDASTVVMMPTKRNKVQATENRRRPLLGEPLHHQPKRFTRTRFCPVISPAAIASIERDSCQNTRRIGRTWQSLRRAVRELASGVPTAARRLIADWLKIGRASCRERG